MSGRLSLPVLVVGVRALLDEELGDLLAAVLRRDDEERVSELVDLVQVEDLLLVGVHVRRTEVLHVRRLDQRLVEPLARDLVQRLLELQCRGI